MVWRCFNFGNIGSCVLFRVCRCGQGLQFNRWRGFYDCPAVVDSVEEVNNDGAKDTEVETVQPVVEEYVITAYCPCTKCCGKSDGITASGEKAVEGVTIAADTNILPFGTKVIIDGNTYIVQDRGGAIKGNRIDLYFDSHQEALNFGRQTKEVTILN